MTVDDYIAAQAPPARATLGQVRGTILAQAAGAEESIAYGMPTYKLAGRLLLHMAGWADHYSIYPVSAALLASAGAVPAGVSHEKSTLRFAYDQAVPTNFIERIVRLRLAR
jgi:uncharacterized protein YdhG (YjbR/CyaY superfamily)